jgi:hypothetical protein
VLWWKSPFAVVPLGVDVANISLNACGLKSIIPSGPEKTRSKITLAKKAPGSIGWFSAVHVQIFHAHLHKWTVSEGRWLSFQANPGG